MDVSGNYMDIYLITSTATIIILSHIWKGCSSLEITFIYILIWSITKNLCSGWSWGFYVHFFIVLYCGSVILWHAEDRLSCESQKDGLASLHLIQALISKITRFVSKCRRSCWNYNRIRNPHLKPRKAFIFWFVA